MALRAVIVSHAAVVGLNQEPFHLLAANDVDVTLIAPRALETDIRGRVTLEAFPGFAGRIVALPVALGGYRRALGGQRGIHLIVYRGLARAIAAARPEVIFVEEEPHSLAAWQVAGIARRLGIPFVVHENQNIARRLPFPFGSIRRRVLARASGVTVRNAVARDHVRAEGFRGPVVEFPHGVDPSRFANGIASGLRHPVVGFVGRLVVEKGITDLIGAVAGTTASLLVVGDGPLMDQARSLAAALEITSQFTGAVPHDEVPRRYAGMDVVAIPSRTTSTWKEQFGRIVIEANAAGVPVVVTDSGELPRTVETTGGGVVVPEGDAGALREALRALCEDEERRHALGAAGRAGVAAHFTTRAIAAELARFLREVAA